MDHLLHWLDLLGTGVFAITGALAAGRKRMDIFGVIVLGCVTALGGGTMRDIILGATPVFWIPHTHYLAIAILAAVGTFGLAQKWRFPQSALAHADAVGLAVFSVIGFERALEATGNYSISTVMGMMTGVAGGIIRDILSGEVPLILRREIYASASLCGTGLLAFMVSSQVPRVPAITISALIILLLRLTSLRRNLGLPLFSYNKTSL